MTEKEFRRLVTDLEILNEEKNELQARLDKIKNLLEEKHSNYYNIVDVKKTGSWAKGVMLNDTDEIDIMVVVSFNNKRVFMLDNYYVLNDIENILINNYKEIVKYSHVSRNNTRNIISVNLNGFRINLHVRYLEDGYLASLEEKQIMFTEIANRDYTYFRNALKIIKYYKDSEKLNISGYILEIMLYYSLNEYFKDNRYEDYLNGFIKTVDEFLKGNKIEVSKDIYQKLEIDPKNNVKKNYMVLDIVNPNNNLTDYVTEVSVTDFRRLKKILSKLISSSSGASSNLNVVININPVLIPDTSEYAWSYKIEGTHYSNSGGTYSDNSDAILTAYFKGLYKGLRAVVDNNLNRKNILIDSSKGNILKDNGNYSEENKSRIRNIESYIENNGLTISFK